MNSSLITLDGATGEGGGQILRTALALAAIAGRPTEIVNIRAARPKPGLAHQHLAGVRAVAEICNGRLEGAALGSRRVLLEPGPVAAGEYLFDVAVEGPSAGAVTLVVQAIVPVLAAGTGSSRVVIRGGTHVAWSPPFHYLRDAVAPALAAVGVELGVELVRWGWYPEGGGEVRLRVQPGSLRAVDWTARGPLRAVRGTSAVGNLPDHILGRQERAARLRLEQELGDVPVDIEEVRAGGRGRGTACFLRAEYAAPEETAAAPPPAGFDALGARGKPAETVGREVAEALLDHHRSGAVVDLHLADQVLPFLALARGRSAYTTPELTAHLRTNAWVCERMLDIAISLEEGAPCTVSVDGAAAV